MIRPYYLPIVVLFATAGMMASCSDADDPMTTLAADDQQLIKRCSAVVPPFLSADEASATRIDVGLTAIGPTFRWGEGDALGIFPSQTPDSQIKFLLSDGSGSSTAEFDGGDWGLRASASYLAYYPYHTRGSAHTSQSMPVSYEGQCQHGNGSTSHLGAYDYVTSASTTVKGGSVTFQMRHVGALVRLTLQGAPAGSYSSMSIESDNRPFTLQGVCDLTSGSVALTPVKSLTHIGMQLDGVNAASPSADLVIYLMLPPADYTGSRFIIVLRGDGGDCTTTIAGRNLEAGRAYALSGTLAPYEYPSVDLGLSVRWATFNEGAAFCEEGGNYYAWGETVTKPEYNWKTYSHCRGAYDEIIKYGIISWYAPVGFTPDKRKQLLAADDAPAVERGGGWRSPLKSEMDELVNSCTWTWETFNGVGGYRVTGPSGASIFLPAAGHHTSGDSDNGAGYVGVYMSGELGLADFESYCISFTRDLISTANIARYEGNAIRPVWFSAE